MKWIKQSHNIHLHMEPKEMLKHIERCAKKCYQAEHNISETSYKTFVQKLIDNKHESTIEHISITVDFITSRGVTHELVRHRLCSFSQESTRYCNYTKDKFGNELTFIAPEFFDIKEEPVNVDLSLVDNSTGLENETNKKSKWQSLVSSFFGNNKFSKKYKVNTFDLFVLHAKFTELCYNLMINKMGKTPQQAREILPNCLKTEISITANLREWRHILDLRCSKFAHPEMRALMFPLLEEFNDILPEIFKDIYDKYTKIQN